MSAGGWTWAQWRGREGVVGRIKEAKAGRAHFNSNVQPDLEEIHYATDVLIWVPNSSLCGAWLMKKWSPPVFSSVQITSDMHRQEKKKESTLVFQATEMQSGKALLRLCSRNSLKNLPKQGELSGWSFYIRSCSLLYLYVLQHRHNLQEGIL